MSCKLPDKALEYMLKLLKESEDDIYGTLYDNAYDELRNRGDAELKADLIMEEFDDLLERLKKGECPTPRQKWMIKQALIFRCHPDDKDYVLKVIAPALRMRVRKPYIDVICTETEDFTKL